MISINEAAARRIDKVRNPVWSDPMDHLKIDILPDSTPGPWVHLYSPFNEACNGKDPVSILCLSIDYDEETWEPYTGPDSDSDEYQTRKKDFSGVLSGQ